MAAAGNAVALLGLLLLGVVVLNAVIVQRTQDSGVGRGGGRLGAAAHFR